VTGQLFHVDEPAPAETVSADRRRTIRQTEAIKRGQHPLSIALRTPLPLHPDADARGLRCGSCCFWQVLATQGRSYPKCTYGARPRSRTVDGRTYHWNDHPRASHGAGTDCRAWWPACQNYEAAP
jgi:hypothetical protein